MTDNSARVKPLEYRQVRVVRSVVSGGDVIDRLHGLSQRTVGVFWLSVLGFVAWALTAMVWGDSLAFLVAAIWAGTMTVLLSYFLLRDVWPAVLQLAVLETLLSLRFGGVLAAVSLPMNRTPPS